MKLKKYLLIPVLALLISSPLLALADDNLDAKGIFLNYQKLNSQKDSTEFGKWFRTTALLTAHDCFREAYGIERSNLQNFLVSTGLNVADVKRFLNSGFESTGVYSSPRTAELKPLCAQIASSGFKPFCITGSPHNPDLLKKRYHYPLNYLVVKSRQVSKVVLNLKCAVTFKETTTENGIMTDSLPNQDYQVHDSDILSLEGTGLTSWSADSIFVSVATKALPANYRASSPLNLPGGIPATDVMATSLALKIKSLPTTFSWLMVIEPD